MLIAFDVERTLWDNVNSMDGCTSQDTHLAPPAGVDDITKASMSNVHH